MLGILLFGNSLFTFGVSKSFVWGLDSLRLKITNSYVSRLVFERFRISFFTLGG